MKKIEKDLKEEIFEALNFTINSGYFSQEEITEYSKEYLNEIFEEHGKELSNNELIVKLISEANHSSSNSAGTDNFKRLRKVFDLLNKEQIIALDYAGFDQSEGHEDVGVVVTFMQENNIPRKGYCFFHQQDIERSMDPEIRNLFLSFHSTDGNEKKALEIGNRIVSLLLQNNFSVHWDGTLNKRIMIDNFVWDKKYDQQDTHVERAIRIIKETYID